METTIEGNLVTEIDAPKIKSSVRIISDMTTETTTRPCIKCQKCNKPVHSVYYIEPMKEWICSDCKDSRNVDK